MLLPYLYYAIYGKGFLENMKKGYDMAHAIQNLP